MGVWVQDVHNVGAAYGFHVLLHGAQVMLNFEQDVELGLFDLDNVASAVRLTHPPPDVAPYEGDDNEATCRYEGDYYGDDSIPHAYVNTGRRRVRTQTAWRSFFFLWVLYTPYVWVSQDTTSNSYTVGLSVQSRSWRTTLV